MLAKTYPIQVLPMTSSGLVNRHQADVVSYLVEENRILKEQMDGRALRLNDDQRLASRKLSFRDILFPQVAPALFVLVGSRVEAYHECVESGKCAA